MADPTFNILIKIREDLAGLNAAVAGMQRLNAATSGSAVIFDQFGKPAAAAAAAVDATGKKAAAGATQLDTLRRGAATTTQVLTGMLGATRALPPGLSAAASGVSGLLGSIAAGFGPLGIAVTAISVVGGLSYALYNQLVPAARSAEQALKDGAAAAERLSRARLGQIEQQMRTLATGADKDLAATRQRLELEQRIDQARLAARAATVRADTSLSDSDRASRLAAEDLAARIESMNAQLESARAEEAAAQAYSQRISAALANAQAASEAGAGAAARFMAERARAKKDLEVLQAQIRSGEQVDQELLARMGELVRLTGDKGIEDEAKRLGLADTDAEAFKRLATEAAAAADAVDRARIARTQLETAAPDIIRAQASEVHALNAAEQEQLRIRAQARDRATEQLSLDRRLAEIQQERALVEADRFTTAEQKQRLLNGLLDAENQLLQEKLTKLDQILATEKDPQLRLELQRDRDTTARAQTGNRGARAAGEPLDVQGNVAAELTTFADSFGTRAEAIARIFTGPIKAGVTATRDVMNQLLGTTDYWQKKLGTIGGSIVGSITSAISDMWAQWIAGQIQSFVLEKVFRQQRKADLAGEIALNTANAAVASVGSFGTAAVVGMAALMAVLAAFGGFETGGYTGGTRGRAAGFVHGEEFVFSAEAVDAIGRDYLEEMHGAARSGSAPARGEGRGAIGSAGSPIVVAVGLYNHLSEQRRFQRQEGAKISFDFAQRRQRRA